MATPRLSARKRVLGMARIDRLRYEVTGVRTTGPAGC
jgi:hypothetical protein